MKRVKIRISHNYVIFIADYDVGIRQIIGRIKQLHVKGLHVYIIENGPISCKLLTNGEIAHVNRIIYLPQHVSRVMKAMQKGIDIRGYSIWPLANDSVRYGDSSTALIEITIRHTAGKRTVN